MKPSHPQYLLVCRRVDRWIQRVEVGVCLAALATMVCLAFAQVLLRQVSGASLGPFSLPQPVAWFDNIARHMVIWVGVLGASLATAEGRHISIEALPKLLGPTGRRRVDVVVNLAAATACGVLLGLAWIYMARVQMPYEGHLFQVEALDLKVFRWPFLVVVPTGLALMCWRFSLRALEALSLDDEAYEQLRAAEQEVEELPGEEAASGEQSKDAPEEGEGQVAASDSEDPEDAELPRGTAPSASMAEARRALSSSTWDSQEGAALKNLSREEASREGASREDDTAPEDEDDLGEESEEGAALTGDERPGRPLAAGMPSIRSTDEIPIYQDIADDEDLREPELRRGSRLVDSSEELEAVAGIEDLVGDPSQETGGEAEEALEAMARSTDRISLEDRGSDEFEEDDAPLGLGEAATDRLARPGPPPGAPMSEDDSTERGA